VRIARRRSWDLGLLALAVLFASALLEARLGGPLSVPLALALVVVLPGVALVEAFWPRDARAAMVTLAPPERAAFAVGLGLACASGIGLALTALPGGLSRGSVIVAQAAVALAALAVAALRRGPRAELERPRVARPRKGLPRELRWFAVAAVASALLATVTLAAVVAHPRPPDPFIQFYVTDRDGRLVDYPANLTAGETSEVKLGIANHEGATRACVVRVEAERGRLVNESGDFAFRAEARHPLASWNVTLDPGQRWEGAVALAFQEPGLYLVRFDLHAAGDAQPMRELRLWVRVLEQGGRPRARACRRAWGPGRRWRSPSSPPSPSRAAHVRHCFSSAAVTSRMTPSATT
jgi:uncharacterized membrane protein